MDDGCSPPRKQKRSLIKQQRKMAKKYPKVNKWKNSDRESSSSDGEAMQHFDSGPIIENGESENVERNKRPGNQRMKRSSGFMVALKNAKLQLSNLDLADMRIHAAYHKWFEISTAAGRARPYKIDICQTVKCTCQYFSKKNTPCRHILYIYLFILNVPENSNLLQQMYLTRAELNQLFTSNINEEQQSARLTALLETTSTFKNNIIVYPQSM